MSDYNKENITPKSSKINCFSTENKIKRLKDKADVLMNEMNNDEYFPELKVKDDKAFKLLEKSNLVFSKRREEEFLRDIVREKEKKLESLRFMNKMSNISKKYIMADFLFNKQITGNTIEVKLKNNLKIIGQKDINGEYYISNKKNENNSVIEDSEDLISNSELYIYYEGFNIC